MGKPGQSASVDLRKDRREGERSCITPLLNTTKTLINSAPTPNGGGLRTRTIPCAGSKRKGKVHLPLLAVP